MNRQQLLDQENELTKAYWRHRNFLRNMFMHRLKARRYGEARVLDEDQWQQLETDVEKQLQDSDRMLWWITWKGYDSNTLETFNLPTSQTDFCYDILDCSDNQPQQWRRKHAWLDDYLHSQSKIGVEILEAHQDGHYQITAMEGYRQDAQGLANRRFAAELTGTLKQRVDVTSGGKEVKPAVDIAGINMLLDKAYSDQNDTIVKTGNLLDEAEEAAVSDNEDDLF